MKRHNLGHRAWLIKSDFETIESRGRPIRIRYMNLYAYRAPSNGESLNLTMEHKSEVRVGVAIMFICVILVYCVCICLLLIYHFW